MHLFFICDYLVILFGFSGLVDCGGLLFVGCFWFLARGFVGFSLGGLVYLVILCLTTLGWFCS